MFGGNRNHQQITTTKMHSFTTLIVCLLLPLIATVVAADAEKEVINIVLIGATG